MAFQYLDPTNLFTACEEAKKYMRPLFDPLQEYERIARNRPHPGIDKAYPKVTDGTTASVVQKTPRRIIQQLPTGVAKSDQNDWLTLVAGFIFTHRIVPNANSQYTLIQKCWNVVSKALTYGAQPVYVPFVQRGKYFGPDMIVPYVKDVFLEPGKLSDEDANFIIMRSWWQPRDIKALIAREEGLAAKAKDRKESYEGSWDLEALRELETFISQKDDQATTPAERDKNNRSGGVEIYHAFQRGIGSKFYSFHLSSKKLLRTKTNPDPRGGIPIHYMYADTDGSNPIGRGFVELVGAMQNLMDAEVQMYQYNRALMLNPPMIKKGDWNKNQAKLAPNVLADLGSNPLNSWEPVKIDSTAIANFPANYGLMKSQLLNLLSSPDTSISADVGNPGFSKTDAGVKNREQVLNVDDNYIRKQFEAWFEKVAETMVNLYFAERSGIEELQLDPETANKIRELGEEQAKMVNEKDQIRIDYDTETEELGFFVDPSTSEIKDDQDEIAKLNEITTQIQQNPFVMSYIAQQGDDLRLGEVYKQMFQKLGLKNLDKILVPLPKDENGKPQAPPPMAVDKPRLVINYDDVKSPNVRAALLQNAGIIADPKDIAQYDAQFAQNEAQLKQAGAKPAAAPAGPKGISESLKWTSADFTPAELAQVKAEGGITPDPTGVSPNDQAATIDNVNAQHTILSGMVPPEPAQPGGSAAGAAAKPAAGKDKAAAAPSDNLSPEDHQFVGQMMAMGLNHAQAGQGLAMLHHGYPAEDILKTIGAASG